MKIVLTGSVGNIGKPLTKMLIGNGHTVTVISSQPDRRFAIEQLGAQAAIGSMFDPQFLASTFTGADIVYLMETMEAAGDMFDKGVDFIGRITEIGNNYRQAVEQAEVKKLVHLSSVGAHTNQGTGILKFHYNVEQSLRQLPSTINIKFIRPVGFYINLFAHLETIREKGAIISNYGGDRKEPWVSPTDIAEVITEEMDKPFEGRTVRYVASDEASPNEVAAALGKSIGVPGLAWKVIPTEELLKTWLAIGFNEQVANGFIDMQSSMGNGSLYEDYYKHQPIPGKVKLSDFANEFALAYHQ